MTTHERSYISVTERRLDSFVSTHRHKQDSNNADYNETSIDLTDEVVAQSDDPAKQDKIIVSACKELTSTEVKATYVINEGLDNTETKATDTISEYKIETEDSGKTKDKHSVEEDEEDTKRDTSDVTEDIHERRISEDKDHKKTELAKSGLVKEESERVTEGLKDHDIVDMTGDSKCTSNSKSCLKIVKHECMDIEVGKSLDTTKNRSNDGSVKIIKVHHVITNEEESEDIAKEVHSVVGSKKESEESTEGYAGFTIIRCGDKAEIYTHDVVSGYFSYHNHCLGERVLSCLVHVYPWC